MQYQIDYFDCIKKTKITLKKYVQKDEYKQHEINLEKFNDIFIQELERQRKKNPDMKILFIGNGASMSMASHFVVDFKKNGLFNTEFVDSGALLSCYCNDYGYEYMFSEIVKQRLKKGDWLFAISSSGNSDNIRNACWSAEEFGINIITLTGFNENNKISKIGNFNIHVPAMTYGFVESAHAFFLQYILDKILEGRK